MKKTLITIVLASFLLTMPVSSEGREASKSEETQEVSTPISSNALPYLQSIGIGRRRTVRRRRRVMRRMVRHRRRVIRHRRVRRGRSGRIGIPIIPRRGGIGRRRGY